MNYMAIKYCVNLYLHTLVSFIIYSIFSYREKQMGENTCIFAQELQISGKAHVYNTIHEEKQKTLF